MSTGAVKILVLVSGTGSNLQALLDHVKQGRIGASVSAVISDIPNAYALTRAQADDIPALALDFKSFAKREDFETALTHHIDQYEPDIIVLAGFMRILSSALVNKYAGKMINVHPSLLPKYPGLHTHQRAIDANDSEHGSSVHFVTPELDGGPVILQAKVPIFEDDDSHTLAERVKQQEHQILPLVVNWMVQQRLVYKNGQAVLDGQVLPVNGYANED